MVSWHESLQGGIIQKNVKEVLVLMHSFDKQYELGKIDEGKLNVFPKVLNSKIHLEGACLKNGACSTLVEVPRSPKGRKRVKKGKMDHPLMEDPLALT